MGEVFINNKIMKCTQKASDWLREMSACCNF